ncbi:hypothetical protein L596_010200 [Steinernema carpocapsae]|uniref:Uncharacterized protein n=1 Tax=Steinernema carpocapsae TaxID=34508 RepID=A0A4U5PHM4_STECR|nr:hypothetical protein L596_010200 [Steinernema carpocapsae]
MIWEGRLKLILEAKKPLNNFDEKMQLLNKANEALLTVRMIYEQIQKEEARQKKIAKAKQEKIAELKRRIAETGVATRNSKQFKDTTPTSKSSLIRGPSNCCRAA